MQSPMSMQRLCTKPAPGRVVVRCAPRAQSGNPIEALQKTVQRAVSTKAASVSEAPRQSEAADKKAPAGERLAKGDFPRPPPADLIPQTKAGADVKQPSRDSAVMFQGFGWSSCEKGGWYKKVVEKIPDLKASGTTHIWLPPPSQSVAPQGYLPGQLYNLNTPYGNPTELKELCAALKKAGICPMADIVVNHRCADVQDENGVWNKFSQDENPRNGTPIDWGRWAITSDDPEFKGKGAKDTGEDYGPAPDLDHTNEGLRKGIVDWMNWLKEDIGFTNWRFDFVKGYGANFISQYCGETNGNDLLNVGEYWADLSYGGEGLEHNQNGPRQVLCDWLDKAGGCTLFDFPTKGILAEAVANTQYWRLRDSENKPPGLMGWWPSRAVTFIDNHDTGSTQMHWPFPKGKEETGYAYIMTHPGIPCVLWEHYFDDGKKGCIDDLVKLRQRNGINARSNVDIWRADHDLYLACIDQKVFVKLGPRYDLGDQCPQEKDGWKFALSGPDFAIWEKQ